MYRGRIYIQRSALCVITVDPLELPDLLQSDFVKAQIKVQDKTLTVYARAFTNSSRLFLSIQPKFIESLQKGKYNVEVISLEPISAKEYYQNLYETQVEKCEKEIDLYISESIRYGFLNVSNLPEFNHKDCVLLKFEDYGMEIPAKIYIFKRNNSKETRIYIPAPIHKKLELYIGKFLRVKIVRIPKSEYVIKRHKFAKKKTRVDKHLKHHEIELFKIVSEVNKARELEFAGVKISVEELLDVISKLKEQGFKVTKRYFESLAYAYAWRKLVSVGCYIPIRRLWSYVKEKKKLNAVTQMLEKIFGKETYHPMHMIKFLERKGIFLDKEIRKTIMEIYNMLNKYKKPSSIMLRVLVSILLALRIHNRHYLEKILKDITGISDSTLFECRMLLINQGVKV